MNKKYDNRRTLEETKDFLSRMYEYTPTIESMDLNLSEEHRKQHKIWEEIDRDIQKIETEIELIDDDIQKNISKARVMEEIGYRVDDKLKALYILMYTDIKEKYETVSDPANSYEAIHTRMMDLQKQHSDFKKKRKEDCMCAGDDDERKVDTMIDQAVEIRKELADIWNKRISKQKERNAEKNI